MGNLDYRRVLLGAALLLAGSAIIIWVSVSAMPDAPSVLGIVATMIVATGTLLLGTSEGGRPV
jgi:hypothetical protein